MAHANFDDDMYDLLSAGRSRIYKEIHTLPNCDELYTNKWCCPPFSTVIKQFYEYTLH